MWIWSIKWTDDYDRLNEWYTKRSKNIFSNILFNFRAFYYRKFIISDIENILSWKISNEDDLEIINRWCWQWHKFEKIIQLLNSFNSNIKYTWVEPSDWMREKAWRRLSLYDDVNIINWIAQKLEWINNDSISLVSDEQMHHHNNEDNKILIIKEAYRVLKEDWLLLILDTYHPENKFKKRVFDIFTDIYEFIEWSWPYYTHKVDDTIKILEDEWFKIIFNKWYPMWAWRVFWIDFTTQIIAQK